MATVATRSKPVPTYVLADPTTHAEVEIVPSRGGMVTRFQVGDVPVLAVDNLALLDPKKSVRGGIPLLFPIAGPLANDRWIRGAETYEMKQHGFARNNAWEFVRQSVGVAARVTIELRSSPETLRAFPFKFRVECEYELQGQALRILQTFHNLSREPMPLHAGAHPYFHVPSSEKAKTRIETEATRAYDNVTKSERPFTGFDLTAKEVDLHLANHGSTRSSITRPGLDGSIEIVASSDFTHWVVWTLAGRDFVCVEPWTAPANALNTGERVLTVPPGESHRLWLEIARRGSDEPA